MTPVVKSTIAVVWAQYGPYHFARLRALKAAAGAHNIVGVEIASRTLTYKWQRSNVDIDISSLFSEQNSESVGATKVFLRARSFFLSRKVGVVLVPSYWPARSTAILFAAKSAGARVVMMNDTHRGTARAEGIARLIKRQLIHMFDAALVAGSPQRRYFESMGMSPRSIFEGYDVVDNQHYEKGAADARVDPEVTRHSLRLPSQYFLNVGRMEPKKDLPTLIQAYAAARTLHKAFPKLVLVGSGGQEGALHEMCRALKLTSVDFHAIGEGAVSEAMADVDVYFYGFRQAAVLPRFYAFASAFILPSRREEWGLVVNEALASGVPVICSTSVGAAENIVKDEVTGLQFKAGDVKGLAAHLSFIYGNPEKARAMGKAAVAIMREWGPDRFAKGALEAIEYASCGKRK